MTPKPPTWISRSMIIFPYMLQYEKVSTTTSPVTQTEVVAVKSAVRKGQPSPVAVAAGIISRSVPSRIAPRKVSMMI